MKPFEPEAHREFLESVAGLQRLVDEKIAESDHLDFKVVLDPRDPKYRDTLRTDCAALATAGEGYLVVGIDESRDQFDFAKAVVGLPLEEALALKSSIEDLTGAKIDPPMAKRAAWLVPLGSDRAVVVGVFRGRPAYPLAVEREKDLGTHFVVRERGRNTPLTPGEARLRRRDLDLRGWKRGVGALIIAVALLAAVGAAQQHRLGRVEQAQAHRRLDAAQQARLAERLRQLEYREVTFLVVQDGEAHLLGDQLDSVFKSAGWRTVMSNVPYMSGVGVVVVFDGEQHREHAAALRAALGEVGLATGFDPWPGQVAAEDPHIGIFVGTRAPPQ